MTTAQLREMLTRAKKKPDTGHVDVCSCEDCMVDIHAFESAAWDAMPSLLDLVDAAQAHCSDTNCQGCAMCCAISRLESTHG